MTAEMMKIKGYERVNIGTLSSIPLHNSSARLAALNLTIEPSVTSPQELEMSDIKAQSELESQKRRPSLLGISNVRVIDLGESRGGKKLNSLSYCKQTCRIKCVN